MPRKIRFASAAIAAALTMAIAAAGAAGAGGPAGTTHLVIRHVPSGCHVWSNDGVSSTSLRLKVAAGARVHVVNGDAVPHQLVQLAGPRLALNGHLMVGMSQLITLRKTGLYRFTDKVVKMGPPPKEESNGPDNTLRLTITVR